MFFQITRLCLFAALCVVAAPSAAQAGEIVSATFAAKSYPGSRERRYRVFVPSSYDARSPVPLVMVLHGCQQTEQDMIDVIYGPDNRIMDKTLIPGRGSVTRAVLGNPYKMFTDLLTRKRARTRAAKAPRAAAGLA